MNKKDRKNLLTYFVPGRSVGYYAFLVMILAVSFLAYHYSESGYRSYLVEFVIQTDEPVDFDIYYDVGRGYNEVDHQSMVVEETGVPTTISFCIPVWTELEKLRFDPAKKHARMTLYSITIFYDNGVTYKVPLDTFDPQKHIMRYYFDGTTAAIETDPEGDDPIFVLKKIRDEPTPSRWKNPAGYVIWMVYGLFVFLLGTFVHRYFLLAD